MQIKKDNLKEDILAVAREEFFLHGYEDASLRVIAKKANTSLGNIYHYYANKEDLLDCILTPYIKCFDENAKKHVDESYKITNSDQLGALIDEMNQFDLDNAVFKTLMSKELVILAELKSTRFVEVRERLIRQSKAHIAWHLNLKEDDYLVNFVLKLFLDGFIFLIKKRASKEETISEFKRMFRVLCSGIVVEANENKDK